MRASASATAAELAAVNAGRMAERHEAAVRNGAAHLKRLHERAAEMHRRAEHCHRATAAIFRAQALRCLDDAVVRDRLTSHDTMLLGAVAAVAGCDAAAMRLRGRSGVHVTLGSNSDAAAAAELEVTLAEGPGVEVLDGALWAAGQELGRRWPRLAAEVAGFGYTAMAATRVGAGGVALGELLLLDEHPRGFDPGAVSALGDAFAQVLLDGDTAAEAPALTGTRDAASLHQATGVVAAAAGCSPADALALLRARAFASGLPLRDIGDRVVSGELQLID